MPKDVSLLVLSNLDVQGRATSCTVNRNWRKIAGDNLLWLHAFPEVVIPKEIPAKQYIDRCTVGTRAEVADRLKNFILRMPMNGGGTFRCLFPFQTDHPITAVMKYGVETQEPQDELCIFVGELPDDSVSDSALDCSASPLDEKSVLDIYGAPQFVPQGANYFMFYAGTKQPAPQRVLGRDNEPLKLLTQVYVKGNALTAVDYLCKTLSQKYLSIASRYYTPLSTNSLLN